MAFLSIVSTDWPNRSPPRLNHIIVNNFRPFLSLPSRLISIDTFEFSSAAKRGISITSNKRLSVLRRQSSVRFHSENGLDGVIQPFQASYSRLPCTELPAQPSLSHGDNCDCDPLVLAFSRSQHGIQTIDSPQLISNANRLLRGGRTIISL